MFKFSLREKLVVITVSFILFALAGSIFLPLKSFIPLYKKSVVERVFLRMHELKDILEDTASLGFELGELEGVDKECRRIIRDIPYGTYCFVADTQGRVYYHNLEKEKGKVYRDKTTLKALKAHRKLMQCVRSGREKCVYDFSLPLYDAGGRHFGVIRVGALEDIFDKEINALKERSLLLYVVFVIFTIASVSLLNRAFVIEPLQCILKGLERFSRGELGYKIKIRRKDEFGVLSSTLNQMAQSLLKTQKELLSSKEYIESIIENISDALVVVDADKKITMVNAATLNLLGYKKEEIIGASLEKITTQNILDEETMEELAEKKVLHNLSVEYITKDKEKIPLNLSVSMVKLKAEDETPHGFVFVLIAGDMRKIRGLIRDLEEANARFKGEQESLEYKVNERTKELRDSQQAMLNILEDLEEAKEDIEISRRSFLNIVEKSTEGIAVVNKDGRVLFANNSFCRLVEIGKEKLPGIFLGQASLSGESCEVDIVAGDKIKKAELREVDIEWRKEKAHLLLFHDITERIEFEESLRLAAEQWRSTFDAILDAVILLDREGRVLRCNKAAKELLGASYSEIKDTFLFDIFLPEEKLKDKIFVKAIDTKTRQSCEVKYSNRWFLITLDPIIDKETTSGAICIIADVTEEKEAKEEVKFGYWSKTVITEIIKLSLEGISLRDILKRTLYSLISFSWLNIEAKGAIFLSDNKSKQLILMAEAGLPYLKESCGRIPFGECICGRAVLSKEPCSVYNHDEQEYYKCEEKDKHTHFCFPISHGGKYDEENIRGLMVFCGDYGAVLDSKTEDFLLSLSNVLAEIIEFKRTEEELRSTKVFVENIVESAHSIILVLDRERVVVSANSFTEELLGYQRRDIIGKNWFDAFVPEDEKEEAKKEYLRCVKGEKVKGYECSIITKDSQKRVISWYASPLYDSEGNTMGAVALGYDVTERKEMEKSQRLAQLGKLVADMAHEVNNPLMVISGRAQLSLMEDIQNEELKNNLNIIIKECQRAKDIIQRLLRFSRPSKGEFRDININDSLIEVISLIEHQFSLVNINIVRNFDEDIGLIRGDEKQLQEVFINLLNNARDAMPQGGNIEVRTVSSSGGVRIEIKDTGIGMDRKTLSKVFDPFFTTKEKGTGLGLAVCYSIIKNHKGDMWFESIWGKGTTAIITLPTIGGKDA